MRWPLNARTAAVGGIGLLIVVLLAVITGGILAERDRRAAMAAAATAAAVDRAQAERALREVAEQGERERVARAAAEQAAAERAAQRAAEQAARVAAEQAAQAAQQAEAERANCLAIVEQARQARAASAASLSAREAARIPRGDDLAIATAAWRAARRELAVAPPGTQAFADAVARVNGAQRLIFQVEAETRAVALLNGADPADAAAQAEAARLRQEALDAPLPPVRPLNDFAQPSTGPTSESDCP